jgi:hypothetical protein
VTTPSTTRWWSARPCRLLYSDGIRVLDVSDPTKPTEIAYFVPPAGRNPVKPP